MLSRKLRPTYTGTCAVTGQVCSIFQLQSMGPSPLGARCSYLRVPTTPTLKTDADSCPTEHRPAGCTIKSLPETRQGQGRRVHLPTGRRLAGALGHAWPRQEQRYPEHQVLLTTGTKLLLVSAKMGIRVLGACEAPGPKPLLSCTGLGSVSSPPPRALQRQRLLWSSEQGNPVLSPNSRLQGRLEREGGARPGSLGPGRPAGPQRRPRSQPRATASCSGRAAFEAGTLVDKQDPVCQTSDFRAPC